MINYVIPCIRHTVIHTDSYRDSYLNLTINKLYPIYPLSTCALPSQSHPAPPASLHTRAPYRYKYGVHLYITLSRSRNNTTIKKTNIKLIKVLRDHFRTYVHDREHAKSPYRVHIRHSIAYRIHTCTEPRRHHLVRVSTVFCICRVMNLHAHGMQYCNQAKGIHTQGRGLRLQTHIRF